MTDLFSCLAPEERALLVEVLERAADDDAGLWAWDTRGERVVWSDRMYEMWGVRPGTRVTYDLAFGATHHADEAEALRLQGELAAGAQGVEWTYRVVRRDGIATIYSRTWRIGDCLIGICRLERLAESRARVA